MHKSTVHYLVTIIIVLSCFSSQNLFAQYWADEVGGVYNIPAEEYNPTYIGYGSDGDPIYNKIDLQNGNTMQIVDASPLYDFLGNQVATAWSSAIGWNHETDFRDGGIIAATIAEIKVGNTTYTMTYAWSVNTQEGGRRSGWIKVSDLSPNNTIENIQNETKDARMDILIDGGINSANYEEYEVVSAVLPEYAEEYYLDPDRPDYYTAGLARYYYTRDGYISGLKNIPETGRQRFGVQNNNIPLGATFYRDMGQNRVEVNIYPPSSSSAISHTLQVVWGYTITSAGEKIYSWINERTLEATSNNTAFIPDPNKTYYIDCPAQNARLASTGESEDAYTTSTSTTNSDVIWKFVAKGNGSWHIRRAAGGAKPGLRSDDSSNADMQSTGTTGSKTYFDFPASTTSGTYYATLPDGPSAYKRLQINNSGNVKMVSDASTGTWVSFKFTEASTTTVENIAPDGTASQTSTAFGGSASRAIDRNTNGGYWNNSVTHTGYRTDGYWQVKWDDNYIIDQIKIYNRTDNCCVERLSNFKVYVLDDSGNITFNRTYTDAPDPSLTINTGGVSGAHVRIQLVNGTYLSLAEVEVFGYLDLSDRSVSENSFLRATKENGRKVALSWMVNDAQNPVQYEVEHRNATGDFTLLEKIAVDQNDGREVYNLLHNNPEEGQNTYRVKVILEDGAEFYLIPQSVTFESDKESIIFPNPTEGQLFIDLSGYMGVAVDLFLTDISGNVRLVERQEKDHSENLELDISEFQNGLYLLNVKGENRRAISEKVSLISTF